jgi:hypothetical protein
LTPRAASGIVGRAWPRPTYAMYGALTIASPQRRDVRANPKRAFSYPHSARSRLSDGRRNADG